MPTRSTHSKLDDKTRNKIAAEIEYRPIKIDELEQMGKVFNIAFHSTSNPKDYGNRFKNCTEPVLERQVVAVHEGKVIAGIRADYKPLYFNDGPGGKMARHECGEINDVATLPYYRGMGISRRLINMAIDYMDRQGWDLSVLQADPKYYAKDLYESVGFKTLPSTGDIFTVAFGSWRARFSWYGPLALLFPLLPPIARRVAPKPPAFCMDLIRTPNPRATIPQGTASPEAKPSVVRVTGQIAASDPWVLRWRECMHVMKQQVQGLHDALLHELCLEHDLNEPAPARIKKWVARTKAGKAFLAETGGLRGYALLLEPAPGRPHLTAIPSPEVPAASIVGGARFKVEHFQRGRLGFTLPMIDACWVLPEYQGRGWGKLLAGQVKAWLGRVFPIIVCRAASGNVPFRKVLLGAGFHEIAGGITMVRPGKNKELYDKLARAVEPWVLY
ncbi:MAG: GNAT family N-acetyltransferase [Candidatus Sigynarchaeum springense]